MRHTFWPIHGLCLGLSLACAGGDAPAPPTEAPPVEVQLPADHFAEHAPWPEGAQIVKASDTGLAVQFPPDFELSELHEGTGAALEAVGFHHVHPGCAPPATHDHLVMDNGRTANVTLSAANLTASISSPAPRNRPAFQFTEAPWHGFEPLSLEDAFSDELECGAKRNSGTTFRPDGTFTLSRSNFIQGAFVPFQASGSWELSNNVLRLSGADASGSAYTDVVTFAEAWTTPASYKSGSILLGATDRSYACTRPGDSHTDTSSPAYYRVIDGGAGAQATAEVAASLTMPFTWISTGEPAEYPRDGIEVLFRTPEDQGAFLISALSAWDYGVEVTCRVWEESPVPVLVVVGGNAKVSLPQQ